MKIYPVATVKVEIEVESSGEKIVRNYFEGLEVNLPEGETLLYPQSVIDDLLVKISLLETKMQSNGSDPKQISVDILEVAKRVSGITDLTGSHWKADKVGKQGMVYFFGHSTFDPSIAVVTDGGGGYSVYDTMGRADRLIKRGHLSEFTELVSS